MTAIGMDAYSLVVRKKRKKKQEDLHFGLFDGQNNLQDELQKLLRADKGKLYDVSLSQKCMVLDQVKSVGTSLGCVLKAGDYGRSHPLVDIKNGKVKYQRLATDAPLEPFYFQLCLPDDRKKGILLCQRIGQSGIRSVVTLILSQLFEAKFKNHHLVVEPLMPAKALEALLKKSKLSSVRFTRQIIPADFADRFNKDKQVQEGEVELVIRPRRNGFLKTGALVDYLNNRKQMGDLIHIKDFEPDNVKAEIEFSGKIRTIDFGNTDKFKASFDISNDVKTGVDGYATIASLEKVANDLVKDLIKQMN